MKLLKTDNTGIIIILSVIILVLFYLILGFSAITALLSICIFLILPTYLIFNTLKLEQDEKMILSFFIGAGIFPSITYWIGMVISFKIAVLITFIILITIALLINYLKKGSFK